VSPLLLYSACGFVVFSSVSAAIVAVVLFISLYDCLQLSARVFYLVFRTFTIIFPVVRHCSNNIQILDVYRFRVGWLLWMAASGCGAGGGVVGGASFSWMEFRLPGLWLFTARSHYCYYFFDLNG